MTLLEQVFLIHRLPAWHSNRLSRLVKAPKLHVGDTGVACAVLNHSVAALREDRPLPGHLLETWVVQELRRQAGWCEDTTGVVLYDGEDTVPFGEGLFAVPLSRLWTAGK